jgi:hypothetical protein
LRIYDKLIITLALAFSLITVILTFLGQEDLQIYFIADAIVFLVTTLFFTHINPQARSGLNSLIIVIFAGFLVIVALKVIEVLNFS